METYSEKDLPAFLKMLTGRKDRKQRHNYHDNQHNINQNFWNNTSLSYCHFYASFSVINLFWITQTPTTITSKIVTMQACRWRLEYTNADLYASYISRLVLPCGPPSVAICTGANSRKFAVVLATNTNSEVFFRSGIVIRNSVLKIQNHPSSRIHKPKDQYPLSQRGRTSSSKRIRGWNQDNGQQCPVFIN